MKLRMAILLTCFLFGCGSDARVQPDPWQVNEDPEKDMGSKDMESMDKEEMRVPSEPLELSGTWSVTNRIAIGYAIINWYTFGENGSLMELPERRDNTEEAGRLARCSQAGCPPKKSDSKSSCLPTLGIDKGPPEIDVQCSFANSWRSQAQDHLEIGLSCDDGISRVATFDVSPTETTKYSLWLKDVSGSSDWINYSYMAPRCPLLFSPSRR